jgi:ferrous iron transport protein B
LRQVKLDRTFKNIAIVGNPNSGKSSLFNALTGLNQRVGNFPGVTVDKKTGRCKLPSGETVNLVDLPGTYSLYPKSADEVVTFDVLFDDDDSVKIDWVIVVVDASNLKRNLLFCSQILDIKKPVIVALSMMDIARQKGIQIDVNGLSRELGVPVVAVNPRKNKGAQELIKQLDLAMTDRPDVPIRDFIDNYELAKDTIDAVKKYKAVSSNYAAVHFASAYPLLTIISEADKEHLSADLKKAGFNKTKIQAEETLLRYARIKKIMSVCVVETDPLQREMWSQQADKILLHRVYGNLILLLILFLLFQSVFWIAQYPMEWIDTGFSAFIQMLRNTLPGGFLTDLFLDGIMAGINGIVVFIPQIMILFGLITLLEDTGYMSRISFLSDRLMRSVGLNGKSVMPLISAVACAVPAIMAARTIENKKEKLITILVAPFMSCSARLPVYTILISLVIPNKTLWGIFSLQGLVMMGLYLGGFAMALLMAKILSLFLKVTEKSIFLMELPVYRMPRWSNMGIIMVQKARVFVTDAGKIILIISIVLWALSNYGPDPNHQQLLTKTDLPHSMAGISGKAIEPVLKPLGFDWKIGIALITSFAAREVFVGTMATLYSVDSDNEQTLLEKMASAINPDGSKVYTLASGLSLLVFYVLAMQCMSTLAVVKRETGTWRYPILQFVVMGALAYVFSLLTFVVFS